MKKIFLSIGWILLVHCHTPSLIEKPTLILNENGNPPLTSSTHMTIRAVNLGQGDATLFETPSGKYFLIDTGNQEEGGPALLKLFSQLQITSLEAVFITHFDADHYGGTTDLLRGQDLIEETNDDILIHNIYDRGDTFKKDFLLDEYFFITAPLRNTLAPGSQFNIDGITITCLMIGATDPSGENYPVDPEENNLSMVLMITYNDFNYFTAGDLPTTASGPQKEVLLEETLLPWLDEVNILHVSHHGSSTSTSQALLKALNPQVALISVGPNTYGHPHTSVINRLLSQQIGIYQTQVGSGALSNQVHYIDDHIVIEVETDGSFRVNGDPYDSR